MNSITDLLDLEDANISISSIDIEGQTKQSILKQLRKRTSVLVVVSECIPEEPRIEKSIIQYFRITTNLF